MTFWKHLEFVWPSLAILLVPHAIGLYLMYFKDYSWRSYFDLTFTMNILVSFYVPGFILHLSYFIKDKRKTITIQPNSVTIEEGEKTTRFDMSQIERIENHYSYKYNRTPWSDYNYSVFKLRDGRELTVTCLVMDYNTIRKNFPAELIDKKLHFMALLKRR